MPGRYATPPPVAAGSALVMSVSSRSMAAGPASTRSRRARSTSWARMRLVVSRAIGRSAPTAVASSSGVAFPAKPAPVRSTISLTASSTTLARRWRNRSRSCRGQLDVDAGVVELQREIEERRARHEPRAAVGRLHVARVLQLGEQARAPAVDQRGELVAVDDARPVVRPRRGERRVDAEPLGDGARRALPLHEVTDRDERQAPVAELGDETEPFEVLGGTPRRGRASPASGAAPPTGTSGWSGSAARCGRPARPA